MSMNATQRPTRTVPNILGRCLCNGIAADLLGDQVRQVQSRPLFWRGAISSELTTTPRHELHGIDCSPVGPCALFEVPQCGFHGLLAFYRS